MTNTPKVYYTASRNVDSDDVSGELVPVVSIARVRRSHRLTAKNRSDDSCAGGRTGDAPCQKKSSNGIPQHSATASVNRSCKNLAYAQKYASNY